jgi:hypothetical protein
MKESRSSEPALIHETRLDTKKYILGFGLIDGFVRSPLSAGHRKERTKVYILWFFIEMSVYEYNVLRKKIIGTKSVKSGTNSK